MHEVASRCQNGREDKEYRIVLNKGLIIPIAAVHGFEAVTFTANESDNSYAVVFREYVKGTPILPRTALGEFRIEGVPGTASKLLKFCR